MSVQWQREMQLMRNGGATLDQIAAQFGVSYQYVSYILAYRRRNLWGPRKPGWHWAVFREIDAAVDRTFPADP